MIGHDQVILVDFDGTLHDIKHPVPGRRMGPPMPGAKEAMDILKQRGNTLIVFSVRGYEPHRKVLADWLDYYQIPYDDITNIKVQCDWIIDDRAIRHISWANTLLKITGV